MSIRDVEKAALECRDNRCHWVRDRKHDMRKPLFGTRRSDSCTNCGNWRHALQCTDGRIDQSTRHYEYTDAYLEALRYAREDCRKELDRRDNEAKRKRAAARERRLESDVAA